MKACIIGVFSGVVAWIAAPLVSCCAAPAELDPGFGSGGKVTTGLGTGADNAYGAALQADGKIVLAGESWNGSDYDIALVRYNPDGSLDATFNGAGKVTTDIAGADDHGKGVAIQSDGKIVVAGWSVFVNAPKMVVVRYNSDGSLDTTFNGTGHVATAIGTGATYGESVAIQADGCILVAGRTSNENMFGDIAVARFKGDGSLDPTFNGTGTIKTNVGSGEDAGWSVVAQPDGKVVVAADYWGGYTSVALLRFLNNGAADTGFIAQVPFGADPQGGNCYPSLALQPDGKILLAGRSYDNGKRNFAVSRLNADGSLDPTFNGVGTASTAIGTGNDFGYSVAVQPNGRVVVAGCSFNGVNNDFALARYLSDGSLDKSFNATGKLITPIGASNEEARSVLVQPDGKIVAAGFSYNGSKNVFALVRYKGGDGRSDLGSCRRNRLHGQRHLRAACS